MLLSANRDVGVLFRGDPAATSHPRLEDSRLKHVGEALAGIGLRPEAVIYTEESGDRVHRQLRRLGAVLVWVDPVSYGRNRNQLDALLREVSEAGIWVSSHPDVILKLGTKEILARTQPVGWGGDVHIYRSAEELRQRLPGRLATGQTRVLKPNRGNGGAGVRRVQLAPAPFPGAQAPVDEHHTVRVLKATRESVEDTMTLGEFFDVCGEYFDGTYAAPELVIDQPFQERIADGMIRCYLVQNRVAGFGHQYVTALSRPAAGAAGPPPPPPRLYYPPTKPEFQQLRRSLEDAWLPAMQALLDLPDARLPALWDADFLYGQRTPGGDDTFVLCEVNASSVLPFPDSALEPLARYVARIVTEGGHRQRERRT